MTNQEAIRHLENMKWLKGYDNTTVGGVPLGDIIDQIIALLQEQDKPNGKCVNECECWDSAYERGKQDTLKEQEAVSITTDYFDGFGNRTSHCPSCNSRLVWHQNKNYCGECGQAVKWDA